MATLNTSGSENNDFASVTVTGLLCLQSITIGAPITSGVDTVYIAD